jgi:hypothetical protein
MILTDVLHDKDLLSLMIKSNMSTTIPLEQRLSVEQMLQQIPTFLIAGASVSLLNRIIASPFCSRP